jgi:hypothetical protein
MMGPNLPIAGVVILACVARRRLQYEVGREIRRGTIARQMTI